VPLLGAQKPSALHAAASANQVAAVELLLDNGADFDLENQVCAGRSTNINGHATCCDQPRACPPDLHSAGWPFPLRLTLAYTRYSFTCFCVSKNQSSLYYPMPICITHTTVILLRDFCAIYDLPPTLPGYAIHHTILVKTISCKG